MGCSEAFQGNANGAKYPRDVTSHVGFPKNVSRENMARLGELKLKVIIHAFKLSRGRAPNAIGGLIRIWEVIGKESCGLERIYGWIHVHFEAILGFTRNEQIVRLETFRGNKNGAKHPRNVTSNVGFPSNVSGEDMTMPEEVQKCPKTTKIFERKYDQPRED
uniref:Fgenesh protein 14 n=1 Tax=Beta vulgaris TaxID=161934 RepID=Q20CF0_BETVU|nr:Fgenesh protein 14 [Beta vulgaris]